MQRLMHEINLSFSVASECPACVPWLIEIQYLVANVEEYTEVKTEPSDKLT